MTISGLLSDGSQRLTISAADGTISRVDRAPAGECAAVERIVCPGFIDVQVNGLAGIAFNDPALTTAQVETVTTRLWETGVAAYLPTLITDSFENLSGGIRAIRRACRESQVDVDRSILGIHLEGPYLSPEDGPRGAHPLQHVRKPDWDEFQRLQEVADHQIRLLTIAPEVPGAIEFIAKAVSSGVRVAIGHTAAETDCIRAAIGAGACMSTHLGNAAHDRLQRHRNYVYDQLAADELWASLIVDGHHLPPSLVKVFVRAKCAQRVILVSDAAMWAGLAPGIYPWGHCDVEVRADGWIGVVGQPRLAGSGLLLYRGIENVVRFAGVTFPEAVRMASVSPAEMLGMTPRLGAIELGSDATFTLVDWNHTAGQLAVRQTIVRGETVYAASW
jgi:N-acetylglucosamine-6-phosphate deacetylase